MSDSPIYDQVVTESRQMQAVQAAPAPTPRPAPVPVESGDGYDPNVPPPSAVCGYDVDRTVDSWPGEEAPILAPDRKGR